MRYLILLSLVFSSATVNAQHKLEKIWETDTIVAVPESVLPYEGKLYISLIDGAPWAADGKGGIGIIDTDGKTYNGLWVTGLHAPKGMGIKNKQMYVADITEVVVIDMDKASVIKKISVPGAQALNDVTVSEKGVVYVSDSRTGKVWKLDNDVPELFKDSLSGVNGLRAVGEDLLIAAGKDFVKAANNQLITIASLPHGGDGVEPVGNGDYLVSSWIGYLYYVHADGRVETLLNTSAEKKNTADIGYDHGKRIIYVPTFNAKTVVAYRLL